MSKQINVNPDHYKLAGRERPGDVRKPPKQHVSGSDKLRARWEKKQKSKGK